MKKLVTLLFLTSCTAFAQMYGTNYVTVMFDRTDGVFRPAAATEFATNNASIQNLQAGLSEESRARSESDSEEQQARIDGDAVLAGRIDAAEGRLDTLEADIADGKAIVEEIVENLSGGPLFPDFVSVANAWTNGTRRAISATEAEHVGNVIADKVLSEYANYVNLNWSSYTNFRSADPSLTTNDVVLLSSDNLSIQVGDPIGINVGPYTPNTNTFGVWWNDPDATTGYWGVSIGNYTSITPFEKQLYGFKRDTNYSYIAVTGLRHEMDTKFQNLYSVQGKSMAPFKTYNKDGNLVTGIGGFATFRNAVVDHDDNLFWNPDLWTGDFDFSPVSFGWIDQAQTAPDATWSYFDKHATLITPQHVVSANHWHAPVGKTIVFLDRNNNLHYRVITKGTNYFRSNGLATETNKAFGDLWLGMLDRPILDIEPAKILRPEDYGKVRLSVTNMTHPGFSNYQYPGTSIPHMGTVKFMGYVEAVHFRLNAVRSVWLNLDNITPRYPPAKRSVMTIDAKTNSASKYCTYGRYSPSTNTNNWNFVGGDSSTPILLSINGQTVVTHCMWSADGSGPNLSYHLPELESKIMEWGGDYTTLPRIDFSNWPDVSNP